MRKSRVKSTIFYALVALLCAGPIVFGDWDPSMGHKMHFPQLPDPCGWDICLHEQMVADDFLCSETGPITDIHFWVSWKGDEHDWPNTDWDISIWSNMPNGPCGWGQPGAVVWRWNGQGNFIVRGPFNGVEGWHCPATLVTINPDHYNYWQINITDIPEPFIQQQGHTFWLVIQAHKSNWPPAVGWKTSQDRFQSCALWSTGAAAWQVVSPNMTETVDMAFVITGSQQIDWGDAPDPTYPTFFMNNGASHVIVQGLYMGNGVDPDPDGQPTVGADGDDTDFDGDDEDGVTFTTPLVPGQNATVQVVVNTPGTTSAYLSGWVDFGLNGSWAETGDQIINSAPVVTGTYTYNFTVPASSPPNTTTYARFRLSMVSGLSYAGSAPDGEVEDHTVDISANKRLVEHSKWSQPPIEWDSNSPTPVYCGWDEKSFNKDYSVPPKPWKIVADDFRCIGTMPVTSIHWWGSHYGWEMQGIQPPPDSLPVAWRIGFWSNVPAGGIVSYSYPEKLLRQFEVSADRVDVQEVGRDDFRGIHPRDVCYQYNVKLEPNEVFWQSTFLDQTQDNTFWISIVAIYPELPVPSPYPWGWKTRPQHWMDDSVTFNLAGSPQPGDVLDPHTIEPIKDITTGESYDASFELDTDPNYIKWEQTFTGIRDWPHYEDETSMGRHEMIGKPNISRMVADDWICTRRTPVTAVVWWGSYIGYNYQACQTGPQPNPPVKPDYFLISIWTDVAAGDPCNEYPYSHPGRKIWEFATGMYDEVMVGFDKHPEQMPPLRSEPVFRYSVRLPQEMWFKQPSYRSVYWLSIVAVYMPGNDPPYPWGWTNHEHVFGDDAVAGRLDTSGSEPKWVWDELYDQTGASEDMSFILYTDPNECSNCADYDADSIVNFADFADFADEWKWNGPAGGYSNSDLDCNGAVDIYDLDIFADLWLTSCL